MPPKLMAQTRPGAHPGKSDPIDALAIARAALREPDLPLAAHDQRPGSSSCWSTTVRTWSRADLEETGCAGTSTSSTPSSRPSPRSLELAKHRRLLSDGWLPGPVGRRAGSRRAGRHPRLTGGSTRWRSEIAELVRTGAPAAAGLPGCGVLTAAKTGRRDRQTDPVPVARPASPCTPASHRSPRRRARPTAAPARPTGQPATQRRPAPHRGHPDPPRRPRAGLLPAPPRRRRHHHRKPCAPSNAASPASSSTSCPTDQRNRPRLANRQRLDIGETRGRRRTLEFGCGIILVGGSRRGRRSVHRRCCCASSST